MDTDYWSDNMKDALAEMALAMFRLEPEQRVKVLEALATSYCLECGYPAPNDGYCTCSIHSS